MTGLVAEPTYREHLTGPGHPERPARYDAVMNGIAAVAPADSLSRIEPRPATHDEVGLCHTRQYIETVQSDVGAGRYCLSTGDTDICDRSLEVALTAAGGALSAVDAVLSGAVKNAFCVLRPPGHHATVDQGMGFCIFNNAAIAARYAQKTAAVERVLIADWDVHHGNGTQWIFYDDPSVFYFSTHQWPLYPGTGMASDVGTGAGKGTTLNCPFGAGAGSSEIVGAFRSKLIPAMRKYNPQFVIISAGFDSEAGDPLGGFSLVERDFVELTEIMLEIAGEHAEGRLISVLEGGYRLDGLSAMAGAHVGAMTGVARAPV